MAISVKIEEAPFLDWIENAKKSTLRFYVCLFAGVLLCVDVIRVFSRLVKSNKY